MNMYMYLPPLLWTNNMLITPHFKLKLRNNRSMAMCLHRTSNSPIDAHDALVL